MTPALLGLAGPTASGKSAVALAFANTQAVEIISVDSAQVYRGMDIGTAKPSAAERAAVAHHLIDVIEPSESYSAARFVADAKRLVGAIHARGHHALLVGGTMLYFKALREGLDTLPAADAGVRAMLDAQAREHGLAALYDELMRVDPLTAKKLAPGDAQRIQRALEVFLVSGKPMSIWQQGDAPRASALPLRMVSLEPASRGWLHERIALRFDAMLQAGLLDEVRGLRARGDLHAELPSMRCVGYRQAWAALESGDTAPLREQGVAATRQLAKRQLTWLRSMPDRVVVPCDASDAAARALHALTSIVHST